MTAELLKEAIKKLEEAQESLRMNEEQIEKEPFGFFKQSQAHYEIGTALSTLRYTLSKL